MKSSLKTLFFLAAVMICCALFSCNSADGIEQSYGVTLVFNDGRENVTVTENNEGQIILPIPEREGYCFVGWCTDKEQNNFYDISSGISADTVLYAKWTVDYKEALSKAQSEASLSGVKILCKNSDSSIFQTNTSQGSGIICSYSNGEYYLLTNSHVIMKSSGAVYPKIAVYDVYGNEYGATVVAADSSLDLAILKIGKIASVTLHTASVSARIPDINETLLSVSVPDGRINSIELGGAVGYREVSDFAAQGDESEVDFKVLWTDIYAESGSSGGGVFDIDMNLVGLIFAVGKETDGTQKYTFAIPGEKILEFISSAIS